MQSASVRLNCLPSAGHPGLVPGPNCPAEFRCAQVNLLPKRIGRNEKLVKATSAWESTVQGTVGWREQAFMNVVKLR